MSSIHFKPNAVGVTRIYWNGIANQPITVFRGDTSWEWQPSYNGWTSESERAYHTISVDDKNAWVLVREAKVSSVMTSYPLKVEKKVVLCV